MCWHHLYIISSTFLLNKALFRSNGRLPLSHRYLNRKATEVTRNSIGQSPSCQVCPKFSRDLSTSNSWSFASKTRFFLIANMGSYQSARRSGNTYDWAQAIDHGKRVHACFLDVAKAFDRVDHSILEVKLSGIGVRGSCLQWFSSYLRGRKIRTKIDGTLSEAKSISSGVPQGSVLGPLLFIIFFMDLHVGLQSTCALFADDTLLYDINCTGNSLTSPCCAIKDDLVRLDTWSDNCNVKFNPEKVRADVHCSSPEHGSTFSICHNLERSCYSCGQQHKTPWCAPVWNGSLVWPRGQFNTENPEAAIHPASISTLPIC